MTKLSEHAIRAMPYEQRLKNYEREKNDLFYKIAHLSAAEVQEKHNVTIPSMPISNGILIRVKVVTVTVRTRAVQCACDRRVRPVSAFSKTGFCFPI